MKWFSKGVTNDNILSHKNPRFHPLFIGYIFRKATGRMEGVVKLTPPPPASHSPSSPSHFRVELKRNAALKNGTRPTSNELYVYAFMQITRTKNWLLKAIFSSFGTFLRICKVVFETKATTADSRTIADCPFDTQP